MIWNYTCSANFFILYMVQGTFQDQCVCFLSDSCISSATSRFTFSFNKTKWLLELSWVWYAWTVKSGYQILFCTQKTTTLHWLKCQILNICLCSSILETIFPWRTQFAQYTWIAKGQNCAYWHKLSVTLTSDTRHGSHYKCARETTLSKKILLKST